MKKLLSYLFVFALGSIFSIAVIISMLIAFDGKIEYPDRVQEDRLFEIVNLWRKDNGYVEMEKSLALCGYAIKRARDSEINWSHEPFRGDVEWVKKELNYKILGENLSSGFKSEKEVLENWIKSPSHYENLTMEYTHSCVKCQNNTCAQIFATF